MKIETDKLLTGLEIPGSVKLIPIGGINSAEKVVNGIKRFLISSPGLEEKEKIVIDSPDFAKHVFLCPQFTKKPPYNAVPLIIIFEDPQDVESQKIFLKEGGTRTIITEKGKLNHVKTLPRLWLINKKNSIGMHLRRPSGSDNKALAAYVVDGNSGVIDLLISNTVDASSAILVFCCKGNDAEGNLIRSFVFYQDPKVEIPLQDLIVK